MSETKTFVFGNDGANANNSANWIGMLTPLLLQRGIDPNVLMAMNNNWGGNGNQFFWILFLLFFWGNNGLGNGFGNGNLVNAVNGDAGRELIMNAILGNATAISQLASTLSASIGDVLAALNSVQSAVNLVGNQVGMSGQQVINAIQLGNMGIALLLCLGFCSVKEAATLANYENQLATERQTNTLNQSINNLGYQLDKGFCDDKYAVLTQTILLTDTIRDESRASRDVITSKLDAIQNQTLIDKIETLRDENNKLAVIINNGQLSAIFNLMINLAVSPINGAINGLSKEINEILAKLPGTVTIPYSPVVGVPNYAYYGYGYNNGYFG